MSDHRLIYEESGLLDLFKFDEGSVVLLSDREIDFDAILAEYLGERVRLRITVEKLPQ